MAKIKLGALAGEVSGSIGCYTFSHNRGGPYVRLRNIPDKFTTPWAMDAKALLSAVSAQWKTQSEPNRQAWTGWASANPVVDSLGEKRPLTGAQAYIKCNCRVVTLGLPKINLPPAAGPPDALLTLSTTAIASTGTATIAFTPTPLGLTEYLWITGCYVDSPSIQFVKKSIRYIAHSAAAAATALNIGGIVISRLGAMTPGQYLQLEIAVCDGATGLISGFRSCRQLIA